MAAKTEPLNIRLDADLIARIDRIAAELTRAAAGTEITRTTAARTAIVTGVEALEERFGLTTAPKKGGKSKP